MTADPESYVIADMPVSVPEGLSVTQLLARRESLVQQVLALLPEEARAEALEGISRNNSVLLHSVHRRDIAELIA
jgi:hypothetical protein